MRVLVVSAPVLGHLFPSVPLAQALRAAGHEVLVATAGDAMAGDVGLQIEDVAPRFNFGRIVGRMRVEGVHTLAAVGRVTVQPPGQHLGEPGVGRCGGGGGLGRSQRLAPLGPGCAVPGQRVAQCPADPADLRADSASLPSGQARSAACSLVKLLLGWAWRPAGLWSRDACV